MPRYIEENEIYNLFNARGVAQLHVGDIDVLPRVEIKEVVRGRWEEADDGDGAVCSVCRSTSAPVGEVPPGAGLPPLPADAGGNAPESENCLAV